MRRALLETDCVIEVHDARIPVSGRNVNFRRDITGNRPHMLVLNKKDLIFPKHMTKKLRASKELEIVQTIKNYDQNLSEIIFTDCKDNHCPGLRSVSPKIIHTG
jgi:ribosome biogenesis GTPase A